MSVFTGATRVRYGYSCYGYTRGNGKTWHGGIDLEGITDATIRMPSYQGKSISGKVVSATIVTNQSNPTWEWGYYVCVQLNANQTPDAVNYLYFCHNAKNLVKVGQTVKTGDALAVMGNTGNAAQANPPYAHCHFEVRATRTGKGLNPTAYSGTDNKAGTYGADTATVLTDGLRLRTYPSTNTPTLETLQKGAQYPVAQTANGWAFLKTQPNAGGWACIEENGNAYLGGFQNG